MTWRRTKPARREIPEPAQREIPEPAQRASGRSPGWSETRERASRSATPTLGASGARFEPASAGGTPSATAARHGGLVPPATRSPGLRSRRGAALRSTLGYARSPAARAPESPAARAANVFVSRRLAAFIALAVACVAPLLLVALDSQAASPEPALAAFSHRTQAHANVACLQCHRRTTSATPQLPGHSSCAGCHAQQFADQNNAICATCHTRPPAAPVKAFPRLRSFDARFDHARHRNVGCARCHTPRRNGVALSIPAGFSAHTACFGCHTPRAQSRGRDISSCGTCHRVGRPSRTPESSPAYRVNFSHDEHTDRGLRCADCHRVVAGRGRGRQVTSPAPLQHRAQPGVTSCATCHDDKRAFGGDDFSDCKRCHEGSTWRF